MFKALFTILSLFALIACKAQEPTVTLDQEIVSLQAQVTPGPTIIMVTGELKDEMAVPIAGKIVSAELAPGSAPIILVIDSYGGSLDSTATIISAMYLCVKHPVWTLDIGQADSGAAYIFAYGQRRVLWPYSSLLFHHGFAQMSGKPADIIARLMHDKERISRFDRYVANLAKMSLKDFTTHLDGEEWWMTAEEALKMGFATGVGTLPLN